jgi:hypothetical protein
MEDNKKRPAKKIDGRRNNGAVKGISRGQGRKPNPKDGDIKDLATRAIKKVYGSELKAWIKLAELGKDSFPHLKTLMEYAYGKPKEQQDINVNTNVNIPVIDFVKPSLPDKEDTIEIDHKEIKDDGQGQDS